jgi:hypothetical protein
MQEKYFGCLFSFSPLHVMKGEMDREDTLASALQPAINANHTLEF